MIIISINVGYIKLFVFLKTDDLLSNILKIKDYQ